MSTAAKLLRAAAEIAGGEKALAERLCTSEALLVNLMSGRRELPDMLTLRAVDIILASREHGLPAVSSSLQNNGHGSDKTSRRGSA
ncbi:MAG TPA: hypothetical protein VNP36_19500 [Burkholderiales bacterium]|nr:hypothetical protein [Burkholderiales bacterium]